MHVFSFDREIKKKNVVFLGHDKERFGTLQNKKNTLILLCNNFSGLHVSELIIFLAANKFIWL